MIELSHALVVERIDKAIAMQNAEELEHLANILATFCFENSTPSLKEFPEQIFQAILSSLNSPDFKKMLGSYHLLMIIEYDWARLSSIQKENVIAGIERAYPDFADWMACHVSSEILGRFACNEASLQALTHLAGTAKVIPRSLIPIGLESLARETKVPSLREQAIVALRAMHNDLSEQVRSEVSQSLKRLGVKWPNGLSEHSG